jgi:hypothetical protein
MPGLCFIHVWNTGGKSLEANVALVENNAKVGALIACAYAPLAKQLKQEQARQKAAAHPAVHSEGEGGGKSKSKEEKEEASREHKDTASFLQFLKDKAAAKQKKPSSLPVASLSGDELDAMWSAIHSAEEGEEGQSSGASRHYSLEVDGDIDTAARVRPSPPAVSLSIAEQEVEQEVEELRGEEGGAVLHEVVVFGGAVVDQIMTPLDTSQVGR